MYHLVDNLQTRTGDALAGYYVKLKDAQGNHATLYSDENSTPIVSVSGVADAALSNDRGMYDCYVDDGNYIREIYADSALTQFIDSVAITPMFSEGSVAADLASTDTGKGAALIGWLANWTGAVARTLWAKVREMPITPEDFGAVGDGVTDDTAALGIWRASIGTGALKSRKARMDGTYLISGAIGIADASHFEIVGNGTIKIADGTDTGEAYSAFVLTRCTDFLIEGIQIDGNRANRTPAEDTGHLVRLIQCQRVTFRRVRADNGTTDGFYIAAAATGNGDGGGPLESELPSDIVFEDCHADNNWRQGMSIIDGYRITVRGGRYSNTNGAYTTGEGPCAGINVEPDNQATWIQDRIRTVRLENVTFDGNDGFNLLVTARNGVHDVVATDCSFLNNKLGAIAPYAAGTKIIRPYIDGWDDTNPTTATKRGCIDITSGAEGYVLIENPAFENITVTGGSKPLYYCHSGSGGNMRIVGGRGACNTIAAFNGVNCSLEGGDYSPTTSNCISLNGAYGRAIGVTVREFADYAVAIIENDTAVLNCRFIDPSSNNSVGVIRGISGARVRIEDNFMTRTTAAGYGITIAAEMTVSHLLNNRVNGFTGNPYTLTGTVTLNRGNMADGTLIAETAIAA
jgi:hypothetical protein